MFVFWETKIQSFLRIIIIFNSDCGPQKKWFLRFWLVFTIVVSLDSSSFSSSLSLKTSTQIGFVKLSIPIGWKATNI